VEFDDEDGGRYSPRDVPQKRRADETRAALLLPDVPLRADLEEVKSEIIIRNESQFSDDIRTPTKDA
jgi:hypothetical protein